MLNQLLLQETNNNCLFQVKLLLDSETRIIGSLNTSDDGTFFCKRNASHLFRKLNALGLNFQLLTSPSIKFKWIVIDFDNHKLVTSRDYYLAKGRKQHFGKQGFELQVFLALDEFGIEKARAFEKNNYKQPTLFDKE